MCKTLYIYFGIALLVGALMGLCLHSCSAFSMSLLKKEGNVDDETELNISSFAVRKQKRRGNRALPSTLNDSKGWSGKDGDRFDPQLDIERSRSDRGRSRNASVPNTILEEDDTSEDGV